jgi:hypothetical protein
VAEPKRSDEDAKEWDSEGERNPSTVAAKKSCRLKVEKCGDGDEIIAGVPHTVKEVGRVNQQSDCAQLKPEAQTIDYGEQCQPEEHGIELAPQNGECSRYKAEGRESGAEEEIKLIVAEDTENVLGRQLWGASVHTSE